VKQRRGEKSAQPLCFDKLSYCDGASLTVTCGPTSVDIISVVCGFYLISCSSGSGKNFLERNVITQNIYK
jgi:hypothetical protein